MSQQAIAAPSPTNNMFNNFPTLASLPQFGFNIKINKPSDQALDKKQSPMTLSQNTTKPANATKVATNVTKIAKSKPTASHAKAEPGQVEDDAILPVSYPTIGQIDLGEVDEAPTDAQNLHLKDSRGNQI